MVINSGERRWHLGPEGLKLYALLGVLKGLVVLAHFEPRGTPIAVQEVIIRVFANARRVALNCQSPFAQLERCIALILPVLLLFCCHLRSTLRDFDFFFSSNRLAFPAKNYYFFIIILVDEELPANAGLTPQRAPHV
jgi:hypothetical protein